MKKVTNLLLFLFCANVVVGQFEFKTEVAPYGAIQDMKSIDLDLDGDLDIVAIHKSKHRISWFENEGGGIFGPSRLIANVINGNKIECSDVDGDGDIDILLCTTQSGSIYWYENVGNEIFNEHLIATGLSQVFSINFKDINNDSINDIVVISRTTTSVNSLSWYENLGGGNFSTENVIYTFPKVLTNLTTGDIDLDGDADIVVSYKGAGPDDNVSFFENLGNGTFGSEQIISYNQRNVSGIELVDIDYDNDIDIICVGVNIMWYNNIGGMSFNQNLISNGLYANSLTISDVDGDNKLDLIVTCNSWGNNGVYLVKNLGAGSFSQTQLLSNTWQDVKCTLSEDFDQDGDMDIVSGYDGDEYFNVLYHENIGAGVFSPELTIETGHDWITFAKSADIDGDGDMDIVAGTRDEGKLFWYENYGDYKYSARRVIGSVNAIRNAELVDIDNDGDIDILTTELSTDWIRLFENTGGGIFTSASAIFHNGSNGWQVRSADIDGDGNMDVIGSSSSEVAWSKNLTGGSWAPKQVITSVSSDYCHYIADIDGDGDNDIVVARLYPGKVSLYENLGGGVFGAEIVINLSLGLVEYVSVGDVDDDGNTDILSLSKTDGEIVWFRNLGGNTFDTTRNYIDFVNSPSKVIMKDVNGDGKEDIIYNAFTSFNSVLWKENLGGGNYSPSQIIASYDLYVEKFHFADMGGMGSNDLITLSASTPSDINVYKNHYNSQYQLKGKIYYDANQNAILDSTEIGFHNITSNIQPSSSYSFSTEHGNFYHSVDSGTYTVSFNPINYWGLSSDSLTYNRTITGQNPIADSLDFGFYPDTTISLIQPDLTGGFPRCNDTINFWATIQNEGTTLPSGIIHLQLHDSVTYVSSAIPPDSINGQNIYWHYDSLFFFSSKMINLQVHLPDFNSMGDTLVSYLTVNELDSLGSGLIIYSNKDTLEQILVCAYDPNDKTVNPTGYGVEGFISNDQDLEYLIRFQNTGNDTAINILISDQLDMNLNWATLQPISSSSPVQVSIDANGVAKFRFNNIMLPDSNVDFLGSQGFVKYKIDLISGLPPHTKIRNFANIFFDSNPPITTNSTLNTIECYGTPLPIITYNFPYMYAGVSGNYIFNWYLNDTLIMGATTDTLVPNLSGDYTVEIIDSNNCSMTSNIYTHFMTSVSEIETIESMVYPNPFTESTTILVNIDLNDYNFELFNILGKKVLVFDNLSGSKIIIYKRYIGKGMFFPVLTNKSSGKKLFIEKLVVQ